MKRKICVITGSRAEYGLLRPLIEEIGKDKDLKLQLIATGMHLSRKFGFTYKEIESDGFRIAERINILLNSDTPVGVSKSIGLAVTKFAEAYQRLRPDIIVVLGDRFEIFSAVSAALISRIPVAHIHGGELTMGVFDDALRHSITKMSHLHFASTETYRKRIIQLGERPEKVFKVGAIGLDGINRLKLLSKMELEKELGFRFNRHNLLITFHSVTLENNTSKKQFENLLAALSEIKDTNFIFTKANADTGGGTINRLIDMYVFKNKDKAVAFTSMGRLRYLSALQCVDAVVGNSSSGIIEAPVFKIATVNIGDRQDGRIKAASVIDCEATRQDIVRAIKKSLSPSFRKSIRNLNNPYGRENSSAAVIKEILKSYNIRGIIKKRFYDIDFKYRRQRC